MTPEDRSRLTARLQRHVAEIATDLRAQMLAGGAARQRARKLHADEQVGEDFEVWTDLLSRRAAVLWVLKSVYVRVLEDKGLISPGRLFDPEAWQLFEKLAPNLGETAFLRWIYRDLSSPNGGLPELFGPQPAEVAAPSDELSRSLIATWRERNPDTGHHWSFAEERFDGELMGDLYQELDPTVKDRFALCQTPDFVREFILDRTLTPAIEEFGADTVRLLDPACGSGHFLIDGLKRLVVATAEMRDDWDRGAVVRHALERVVGIDLNDYACALARARLIMTAADLAGVTTLAEAAEFHPHVYWADGLEQVERGKDTRGHQLDLLDTSRNKAPKASLTRPEVRAALRAVLLPKFQVVAANPPYIIESDAARKAYHTERVGRSRRYISAHRQYHLSEPFTERCFQLAQADGYVGLIVDDSFMKKAHGKKLVEAVLSNRDLFLVVDSSQAHIPYHGTPTTLLFGRNRRPRGEVVRAVMGKRGETGTPSDPREGKVWKSIETGWDQVGFENEYVSVDDIARNRLACHPWSLRGGGAAKLKATIESAASQTLKTLGCDIGRTTVCGQDPVFIMSEETAIRRGAEELYKPLATGTLVRDWQISQGDGVLYPYQTMGGEHVKLQHPAIERHFWPFRSLLQTRSVFGKSPEERGSAWFEHLEHYTQRLKSDLALAFPFVATHNHFVLDRGGRLFNRTAPVVKLPEQPDQNEEHVEREYLWLLGLLNSSVMGFWLAQICQAKGGESTGKKRQSEAWSRRLEHDAGKVAAAPIPERHQRHIRHWSTLLDTTATELARHSPHSIIQTATQPERSLASALSEARAATDRLRKRMVALQEELDWTVYCAYGLLDEKHLPPIDSDPEPIDSAHRPFAVLLARDLERGEATRYWFDAMKVEPTLEIPASYTLDTQERIENRIRIIEEHQNISLLESPNHKRKWEPVDWDADLKMAARDWLSNSVEGVVKTKVKPLTVARLVAEMQTRQHFLEVASIYQNRRHVDLDALVLAIFEANTLPNHPFHIYTAGGLVVREAWEQVWNLQRRQDRGEYVGPIETPPEYSQGSRGKPKHFLRNEYWKLRGKLDVPKERFIAFTEVPGRDGDNTLYGWAGWTPIQRIRVVLALDEDLEDDGHPLADRAGLLDSAWRLLHDAEREDATVANRLRAELRSIIGGDGFSAEQLAAWQERSPPPRKPRRR